MPSGGAGSSAACTQARRGVPSYGLTALPACPYGTVLRSPLYRYANHRVVCGFLGGGCFLIWAQARSQCCFLAKVVY